MLRILASLLLSLWLSACSLFTPSPTIDPAAPLSEHRKEVMLFSMSLMNTGYRFGGKNPEAGLDCSGMVSYIYANAVNLKVTGSAADIAKKGRSIDFSALRPGDLVFFNTLNRPFSHVGLYIGEQRFIHAPSSNGRVRIDRLDASYFAKRLHAARAYLD